jgi:hypothetical protein
MAPALVPHFQWAHFYCAQDLSGLARGKGHLILGTESREVAWSDGWRGPFPSKAQAPGSIVCVRSGLVAARPIPATPENPDAPAGWTSGQPGNRARMRQPTATALPPKCVDLAILDVPISKRRPTPRRRQSGHA